jgi:hypothetical protein
MYCMFLVTEIDVIQLDAIVKHTNQLFLKFLRFTSIFFYQNVVESG